MLVEPKYETRQSRSRHIVLNHYSSGSQVLVYIRITWRDNTIGLGFLKEEWPESLNFNKCPVDPDTWKISGMTALPYTTLHLLTDKERRRT